MDAINIPLLLAVFHNMEGRVTYSLGGKADALNEDSHDIDEIDCSGFVRYAVAKATNSAVIMPDGSSVQHDWCDNQGLHKLAQYSNVQYGKDDPNRLFIGFIQPAGGHPGHVWLIYKGKTLESHGGAGVSSRDWDTPILLSKACAAYELPCEGA